MPLENRNPTSQIMRALFAALLYAGLLLPPSQSLHGANPSGPLVITGYHLTARPWQALDTPAAQYLDAIEGLCRFTVRHQNAGGAVIDPFLRREHQYATPYFAAAVAALAAEGRAADLLEAGARAMDHATACFAGGRDAIPDQHGEFFVPALTFALELYKGRVAEPRWQSWRERLTMPLGQILGGGMNNWQTYPMKGEWMRAAAGLASRDQAVAYIEKAWTENQRARIAAAPWRLYHDRTSDPDTLNVEAVGRGNLLALAELGYDGPSSAEIREAAEAGSRMALYLADPTGQAPVNGRTDCHVWVDAGYALGFEAMAARAARSGDAWLAGQFRRAAALAFQNLARWRRDDGEWAGSYYITKNRFDPRLRVGYQQASQYSNYSGSLMFHLAELVRARRAVVPERPAPAEIGGYAVELDREFASVFANAGGFQMQANLRGQTTETHGNRWTPLGVVRLGRPGWDTRLGPSDGALTASGGVSFAPEFLEGGQWLRMAGLTERYEAAWSVTLVHPMLVRCSLDYRPKPGLSGPAFRHEFTLTPDGLYAVLSKTAGEQGPWGLTLPLLENDGTPLRVMAAGSVVSTRYPSSGDEQNFIALNEGISIEPGRPLRGSYGDLRPARLTAPGRELRVFVYPRSPGDPDAQKVRDAFTVTKEGFTSPLGRLKGNVYAGRTSAGGVGLGVDLRGDGKPDVSFSGTCGFIAQVAGGRITAIEVDRPVRAAVHGRKMTLKAHTPVQIGPT